MTESLKRLKKCSGGHQEWLKNLPQLKPTNIVGHTPYLGKFNNVRGDERSKTFHGVAQAMADQWGSYIISQQVRQHTTVEN